MANLKFTLQKVRLNNGGYDSKGRYYGTGSPLYYAAAYNQEDKQDIEFELRADNRRHAKGLVREKYPTATFYN